MNKKAIVFHPSVELYGADRIMVEAIKAFPTGIDSIIYLPKDGPLIPYIKTHLPNAEIVISTNMPIISRAMFTPTGIVKFIRNWLGFRSNTKKYFKDQNITLGYVNTLACVFILPILKRRKVKRLVHVHEIIDRPKLIGWLTAFVARMYANKVVCVSKAVERGLKRYVQSITKKTVVIHNGIQGIDVKFNPSDKTNFYLFGRIKPEKGQWFLVKALEKIDNTLLEQCRFTLMGGVAPGQEQALTELKNTISNAGLSPYVFIKDFANTIDDAMEEADVCLVPSQMKDPFPTTVLEAMSAGRPVIATNHGGAAEALDDQSSGFLIDPDSTDELATAITLFIRDKALVTKMGQNAKKKYEQHFTRKHFQDNWSSFIADTIK